eukprot:325796-Lingulodinium_polyedra.AAC.1
MGINPPADAAEPHAHHDFWQQTCETRRPAPLTLASAANFEYEHAAKKRAAPKSWEASSNRPRQGGTRWQTTRQSRPARR